MDFVWKTKKATQVGLNFIPARVGGTTATDDQWHWSRSTGTHRKWQNPALALLALRLRLNANNHFNSRKLSPGDSGMYTSLARCQLIWQMRALTLWTLLLVESSGPGETSCVTPGRTPVLLDRAFQLAQAAEPKRSIAHVWGRVDLGRFLPCACIHICHPETTPRRLLNPQNGWCNAWPLTPLLPTSKGDEKEVLAFLAACVVNEGGTNNIPSDIKEVWLNTVL